MRPVSELPRVREAITAAGVAGITVRELVRTLGLSARSVFRHVATLQREGFLVKDQRQESRAGRPEILLVDRRFRR